MVPDESDPDLPLTRRKEDEFVDLLDFSHLEIDERRTLRNRAVMPGEKGEAEGKEEGESEDDSGSDHVPGTGVGGKGRGKREGRGERESRGGRDTDTSRDYGDPFRVVEREVREFEIRFGSRYLQILGVFVISIAFSILGYYPTDSVPLWGQVAFMFLGAAILVLAGEILIERKEMEFYALGLIFAGIKLTYSSFWSLYYNFELIDETYFTGALVLTLALHYTASLRYRSAVLNASFVFLSWLPLVLLKGIYPHDSIILFLFFMILAVDYFQANQRKEPTALMMVPATAAVYLYLNAVERTVYDFSFDLAPDELVLVPLIIGFIVLSLFFLSRNYQSRTLLSEYLNEYPGTTFAHLTSLFLILVVLVCFPFVSPSVELFLLTLTFSGLILVHLHERGEELVLLIIPIISALLLSLAPLAALQSNQGLLLPTSLCLLVISQLIANRVSEKPPITELHRQIVQGNHIALALIVLVVWIADPEMMEFLPASFLTIGIFTQLMLSYNYIQDEHIVAGELLLLIGAGGYGWASGDNAGYSGMWIVLFLIFSGIVLYRKSGDLAPRLLLILGIDLLITSGLCGEYILLLALMQIGGLFVLSQMYTGKYFLYKLLIPVNDITIGLKKHRILDLFNISLLLALAISVTSITVSGIAWVAFPFTAALYLHGSFVRHRGKLVLPALLLCSGIFLIYLENLLLLVYLTMVPVVFLLITGQSDNRKIDHYLQMILFITVGLSVSVENLEGAWIYHIFEFDRVFRLGLVYLFYLGALASFLLFAKRYSSLLFTGLVAFGELAALLMFTFEYQYSIPLYFGIMFLLMAYLGPVLSRFTPEAHLRTWERDRGLLLGVSALFHFFPIIIFNYRNDLPEFESWIYGIIGLSILLTSDILRNGLYLQRWKGVSDSIFPGITLTELFALLAPVLLCLNYSREYSIWLFLIVFVALIAFLLFRESPSRIQLVSLYGLIFFIPFNFLLFVGRIHDPVFHGISDFVPLGLVLMFLDPYLLKDQITSSDRIGSGGGMESNGGVQKIIPKNPEYTWTFALAILLLGTYGSSHFAMFMIPILMFFFCFGKKDVLVTPAAYVVLMVTFYLYASLVRGDDSLAMNGLLVFSLAPIYIALINEYFYKVRVMTFSFATLSLMLMAGVPWFAAGSGVFQGEVITSVVWTIFGGTAFSFGFYLDRRYLRYFGIALLILSILATAYNTIVLGEEAVAYSLFVLGFIAILASYFYYLRDPKRT